MRRRPALVPLALLALTAGCSHKPPQVVVRPTDTTRTAGPPPSRPTPPSRPADNSGTAAAITAAVLADLGVVIHFDYDQDAIKPEDRPILDQKAEILKANPAVRIRISGHADERGSDEYNLVLGNKRALAAKRYLESKGVASGRIEVTSLGEERPVDPASNEQAWAKNRRDEFEVTAGGDRLVRPK